MSVRAGGTPPSGVGSGTVGQAVAPAVRTLTPTPPPTTPPTTPGSSDGLCRVDLFAGSCRRRTHKDRGPWDEPPAGPVCALDSRGSSRRLPGEDPAAAPEKEQLLELGNRAASRAGAPHRWVIPPLSTPALVMEVQGREGWPEEGWWMGWAGEAQPRIGVGTEGRTDRTWFDSAVRVL